MVCLVSFFETAQDGNRVFDARFADINLLETAFKGRILFDVFAVLIESRGADHTKLAACEHRLEHVGGHYGTFPTARTHQGVEFVDEGDDATVGFVDFLENGLESFFEFASEFRPGDERRKVERNDLFALQAVGNITGDDALREALDDGSFTDARFTNQNGVVLGSAREHLGNAADLGVPPDNGVEFAGLRNRGEVHSVLFECGFLLVLRGRGALHVSHGFLLNT